MDILKESKKEITDGNGEDAEKVLNRFIADAEKEIRSGKRSGVLSAEQLRARKHAVKILEDIVVQLKTDKPDSGKKAFEIVRDTAGQKPVEKVMIAEVEQDVIDEVERAVLDGEG